MHRRAGRYGVAVVVLAAIAAGTNAAAVPPRPATPRPSPIVNGGFDVHAGVDPGPITGDAPIVLTPGWYSGPGATTTVTDIDGDGDREAVIAASAGTAPARNLYQSLTPPLQSATLSFDALAFTVESGDLSPSAEVRLGFALSPTYAVHPYTGIYNEGSLVLPAPAMAAGRGGRMAISPHSGWIDCPGDAEQVWMPCAKFRSDLRAAQGSADRQRALLGRARIVEVDLVGFGTLRAGSRVVIDDVEIIGDRTIAETAASRGA